jgi:hypothetical protein
MTRILIPLLFVLLLLGSVVSSGQVTKTNKVPTGKTYVYLDENGKEVARRKSGQSTSTAGITDCAQVPCPSTFDKDVVCWKCKKRPATKAP